MPTLEVINRLPFETAEAGFFQCCGSRRWAERMSGSRPFTMEADLFSVASRIWHSLSEADWLEAFSHHPKIGQSSKPMAKWAEEEQAGARSAASDVLADLARNNEQYTEKFGFIFLVCATGKTAEEMLALLKARMGNSPEEEIRIAAGEQAKITHLRLEKLLRS